jgi:hypothetical protein
MAKSTASTASVNVIKNATASIKSVRPAPTARAAAKKTVTAKAVEQVAPVEELGTEDEVVNSWKELMEGFKLPSGRRMAVSVVTQFLVLGTGVYSGFQLGALLAFGAAVLTGSAFLSFLGWFVVVALSFYTSLIAAARVGKYIALGEIDDDIKTAKAWVGAKWSALRSKFNNTEVEVAHV